MVILKPNIKKIKNQKIYLGLSRISLCFFWLLQSNKNSIIPVALKPFVKQITFSVKR